MATVAYMYRFPDLWHMLDKVPEQDRPKDDQLVLFYQSVAKETMELVRYAAAASQPEIVFEEMHQAGEQYIWNFYVNDLAMPVKDQHNFHGQNISQWRYAGCILLQNGRVSRHH